MTSANLVQACLEPTYSSRDGTSSSLDLVFVADPTRVTSCTTSEGLSNSDHRAIEVCYAAVLPRNGYHARQLWKFDQTDHTHLARLAHLAPWCMTSSGDDCIAKAPPVDQEIMKAARQKRLLFRKASQTQCPITFQLAKAHQRSLKAAIHVEHQRYTTKHGSRRDRSCDTALATLNQIVSHNLDNRTETDLIQLDLSNAFDTLNISLLLDKAKKSGIRGCLLRWLANFLIGRSQRYADDTSILAPILSPTTTQDLQAYLTVIDSWIVSNHLKLSPDKSSVMKFSSACLPAKPSYTMRGIPLPTEDSMKILGVMFTSTLDFSLQVASVVAKARRVLGFVFRVSKPCGPATFALLYTSLVLPILEYGCAVWSPNQQNLIARVESVQRRASRTFHARSVKSPSADYATRLQMAKWRPLRQRRAVTQMRLLCRLLDGSLTDTPLI
ncbi:hypothetical protein MTO96_039676, partial [Rhipicephalus appendiculatus]